MRSIYIRNLFRGYWKRKWIIIVVLIIFVVIFGFLGLRRAYPERLDASLEEEVEEYNEAIATYDDAIDGIEKNIATVQEELAAQQEYVDNSILMQIDPEAVQYASVQYIVQATGIEDTEEADTANSNILSTLKAYYDNGSFKSELAEKLGVENTQYLSDVISCGTTGTTFSLGIKHYDMDQAKEILQEMEALIEDYRPEVEEQFGSFTMTSMGEAERVYADTNVLSSQNTVMTNLRTYQNNLSDYQTKLVTQEQNRTNYKEQYAPSGTSSSPRRTILEYGAVGVIAGILIPLAIYAVYYTLSGRIKGKEELQAAGLNVLTLYRPKKGYLPSLEKVLVNLKLLMQKHQAGGVSLCAMGESSALAQVEQDLTTALQEQNLQVYPVSPGEEDAEELQKQAEIGNHVLIVEAGRTTYTQLEEQIQFCQSLDITIWGCVVIE